MDAPTAGKAVATKNSELLDVPPTQIKAGGAMTYFHP